MELVDRYRGSLVGLAIGDAIGHPTEFISSVARIKAKYGDQGVTGFEPSGIHKAGTFTDDTQMTISVARALVRAGHQPLDDLMTLLGKEFVAWADHPTNNRAPGGTCLAGCRKLREGAAWRDAGVKESKGCGAAMRAAPVGLYFSDDDDALVRVAAAQSALTHSHPTGIASSVAAAAPVAWVLKGNGLDGMVEYTKQMVARVTADMMRDLKVKDADIDAIGVKEQLQALDDTVKALADDNEDVCALLGGAWVGEEAVACALWCVLKAKGDFAESVLRGANSSGDSDSIAAIAGSIAGALHGIGGIKPEWVAGVERGDDLSALAVRLYEAKRGADAPTLAGKLDFFDAETPRPKGPPTAVTKVGDSTEEYADPDETPVEGEVDGEDDEPPPATASGALAKAPAPLSVSASTRARALEPDPDAASLTLTELEREVERHNRLYWELAAPVISDVGFDKLTRRLHALRPDSRALAHLGARPDAFAAVKHREPMLSLDKCYDEADLVKWARGVDGDVLAMPKIDGLACSLRYGADGALEVAATRGDGEEGEDITPNARAVASIPQHVDAALAGGVVEVRGEVYMSLAVFAKYKAAGAANPRNLAAGALRQKDPNQTRRMELSFLAYDVKGKDIARQRDKLALVKQLGFHAIDVVVVPSDRAMEAVGQLADKRADFAYETDGVVVMADEVLEQKRMGATAHHPRWAVAWKFQGEEGTSVLRGVEWSVARTGTITPVALVDAVQLSGVTVTRATLHHRGFLAKLGLSLGASIAMVRRGGVIPHVERVLAPGTQAIVVPTHCPACGAPVVEEGDFLLCSKPATCVAARVGRLLHFIDAVDVQGLGEAVVDEAVQSGLLKTPADLYRIKPAQLAALQKCGEKNAQKIVAEIDKARTLALDVVLRGLGIANLGKTAARTLAERYETLARVRAVTAAELAGIKGFGDVIAQSIVDGLRENAELLDELAGVITIGAAPAATGGSLAGKSFVFTGALSIDRKTAEARVKKLGAAVPSSVTKALTHLVVGGSGRDAPSTKQKAAEKLKQAGAPIEILDEAAFTALMDMLEAPAVEKLPIVIGAPPSFIEPTQEHPLADLAPPSTLTPAATAAGAPTSGPRSGALAGSSSSTVTPAATAAGAPTSGPHPGALALSSSPSSPSPSSATPAPTVSATAPSSPKGDAPAADGGLAPGATPEPAKKRQLTLF